MNATTKCTQCRRDLPPSAFSPDSRHKSGLQSCCKACRRKYDAEHPGKVRARRRKHYIAHREEICAKSHAYKVAHPEKIRARRKLFGTAYNKKYRAKHSLRYKAHSALYYALRIGKIARPGICSLCGTECKPEGHHSDYGQALDVIWLCMRCHKNLHVRIGLMEIGDHLAEEIVDEPQGGS